MHRIATETRLVGTLQGAGDLHLDGSIEGDLRLDGRLEVSSTGRFQGEATVSTADISGRFVGSIVSTGALRLLPGSVVEASIQAARIEVHPDARLRGSVEVTDTGLWEDQPSTRKQNQGTPAGRSSTVDATQHRAATSPAGATADPARTATEPIADKKDDDDASDVDEAHAAADDDDAKAPAKDTKDDDADEREDDEKSTTSTRSRRRTTRSSRS